MPICVALTVSKKSLEILTSGSAPTTLPAELLRHRPAAELQHATSLIQREIRAGVADPRGPALAGPCTCVDVAAR